MRKALSIGLIVLLLATGCGDKKPNPRKTRPPKPLITAQEVKICVDPAFNTRQVDEECHNTSATGCCDWRYLRNNPAWPQELPAVREVVEPGRGFLEPLPGSEPVTIPPEGAIFQR